MVDGTANRHPMDFDVGDFWHGAGCAWTCFLLLLLAVPIGALVVTGSIHTIGSSFTYLLYLFGFGMLISGGAVLVFFPLVWWVAKRLRGVRSIPVHLAVHALVGMLIGLIVSYGIGLYFFGSDPRDVLPTPWAWILAAATAVSILAGWGKAARRARLSSAPAAPQSF